MKRIFFLTLLLLAAGRGVVWSQEIAGRAATAAAAAEPLTLEACIEQARANNRTLRAAESGLEAARCDERSLRALLLPALSASGTALRTDAGAALSVAGGLLPVVGADGVPTGAGALFPGLDLSLRGGWLYGGGVQIEQPLYLGGRVRIGVRMAREATALAADERRRAEADVVLRTSRAYADAVRAQELRQVAEAYRRLLVELGRVVERAFGEGMKPRSEVLKVQVKRNESELNLARARHAQRLATMLLCHCIGRPLTDSLVLEGSIPVPTEAEAPTDVADRPEYRMAGRQYELARQQEALTRGERRPQLALVGRYGYAGGGEANGRMLLHGWSYAAGVRLSVPLFQFGRHANRVRAAEARSEQLLARCEETRELLALEAVRAADGLAEAELEVRMTEAAVAAADEQLRIGRRCYEAGIETLSDLLEVQAQWQQARQRQVEARFDRYLRWLEHRQATGRIE